MSGTSVVVSAGTYHLPFNRLTEWMEPWTQSHPDAHVIMQHGPGRPLPGAENHALLPYGRLLELCAAANAVVLQGGAGGVMDMRAMQRIPIVVPRIPMDDEVVDDHQLIFTQRAAELGIVRRVTTREALWLALDAALSGEQATHVGQQQPTPGVGNIGALLAELPEPLRAAERARRMARVVRGLLGR